MNMARTTKMIGFSVPPSIAEELKQVANEERRTKSELFREMFRLYRTYRHQLRQAEEERFQRMIDESIAQGRREKENPTMTQEESDKLEAELLYYGEQQAKRLGIAEKDVDRIVYARRKQKKEGERT
jgi:metal-responsive CopG/Arc/MetJ family transcriptional regulator